MAIFTKRVQAVLSEEQFAELNQIAIEEDKTISELIRDAVDEVYFSRVAEEKRMAALDQLLNLEAPVTDWEQMEAEIIKGRLSE